MHAYRMTCVDPEKITSDNRFPNKYCYGPVEKLLDATDPIASQGRSVQPSVKYVDDIKR